jgi:hypothetical protein
MTDSFQRRIEEVGGFPTIEEWLDNLPEPYRSKAIRNRAAFPSKNKLSNTLWRAVSKAFDWYESPEGYDYWHSLKWNIKNGDVVDVVLNHQGELIKLVPYDKKNPNAYYIARGLQPPSE